MWIEVNYCQKDLDSNFAFIILVIFNVNLIPIKINSREILLKEMFDKVGDTISEQNISEKKSIRQIWQCVSPLRSNEPDKRD